MHHDSLFAAYDWMEAAHIRKVRAEDSIAVRHNRALSALKLYDACKAIGRQR